MTLYCSESTVDCVGIRGASEVTCCSPQLYSVDIVVVASRMIDDRTDRIAARCRRRTILLTAEDHLPHPNTAFQKQPDFVLKSGYFRRSCMTVSGEIQ